MNSIVSTISGRREEAKDEPIVSRSNNVGLVPAVVELNVVYSLVVRVQGEVGGGRAEGPDFDGTIETGGSERV